MTTLADILAAGGGHLPPVEQFDPRGHALLIPDDVYRAAMQAQALHTDAQHQVQPVIITGAIHHGIGADVLTEALPPYGLFAHVFEGLPHDLAAHVLVVPWDDFVTLLPPPPPDFDATL